MKAYLVRKWDGDSYGHGDYEHVGVCLEEKNADAIADKYKAQVIEVELLDVGVLNAELIKGTT